jgi:two-component system LytT family response regulator
MKVILIDDEARGRQALRQKLIEYCNDVEIAAEAENGEQAIELIETHKPDVIFLDIEMPMMNGFELLNNLQELNFHIIFTTAYDHYAIKAIKYSAFDYLLKPIDIEELKAALSRLKNSNSYYIKNQVKTLSENIKYPSKPLNRLAVPTLEGLNFYEIDKLMHLEADSNYTLLHFTDLKKIVASKTLKEFEELLPEELFFRPHHSHIINLNHISKYIKGDGGQIVLSNGTTVDVSRRKKEEFLKLIRR